MNGEWRMVKARVGKRTMSSPVLVVNHHNPSPTWDPMVLIMCTVKYQLDARVDCEGARYFFTRGGILSGSHLGRGGGVSSRFWDIEESADRHGPAPGQGSPPAVEGPATGPGPAPRRGLALLGAMTRLWAWILMGHGAAIPF